MAQRLKADPGRDATASIRGYVYQVYQSIWTWIHLRGDEQLFLEGAEDFDVYSPLEAVATQVKDRTARVTLRSQDVLNAIKHFWNYHRSLEPTGSRARFRFLTTADRGTEQGSPLGDRSGLDYWELAADNRAPVEALRGFLMSLPLEDELKEFLSKATDEEVRNELLQSIHWDTGQRPLEAVKAAIEDDLVVFGMQRGIDSRSAARVLDALLGKVASLLSTKGEKKLTLADYARAFDDATMEVMPRTEAATFRAAAAALLENRAEDRRPSVGPIFQAAFPLVRGATRRVSLVGRLSQTLRACGALLLRGSTGLGKTSIANLVSNEVGRDFGWAGFRGQDPLLIKQRLEQALLSVKAQGARQCIVLDDLDFTSISQFEREFLALLFHVRQSGGFAITTSAVACPKDLLETLWLPAECDCEVPYFDLSEIDDVLKVQGLSDEAQRAVHAKLILATTSGHPQLVHAKVRVLAASNWPAPKTESLFNEADVRDVRVNARRRLLAELPAEGARLLAYRLSIALGSFSRDHALAVSGIAPAISLPGETFDLLVGPWFEEMAADLFRVSPLLRNAGQEVLAKDEVIAVHEALALVPFSKKSVSETEAGTAFLHAILGQSRFALYHLSEELLQADFKAARGLVDSLFVLPAMALGPSEKIVRSDDLTEVFVRVVQFKVAVASRQQEAALASIERTIDALRGNLPEELRAHLTMVAYGAFLSQWDVPIPPRLSIPMTVALMQEADADPKIADVVRNFASKGVPGRAANLSPWQVLFNFESARIEGVRALGELLTELDGVDAAARGHLVAAFEDEVFASLLVNNAWLRDVQANRLDVEAAIPVLRQAAEAGARWGAPNLARAAVVAVSVLYDEYAHQPEQALAELARASAQFGESDGRIRIGAAKVRYGRKEFAAALRDFGVGLNDPTLQEMDRLFATKLMAACAGCAGGWEQAARLFLAAADIARAHPDHLRTMSIGLLADAAYSRWKMGNLQGALFLFADVLQELRTVSVDQELKDRYLHAAVRHVIAWIWANESERRPPPDMVEPPPGMCSTESRHERLGDLAVIDLDNAWHLLGVIGRRADIDPAFLERVDAAAAGVKALAIQAAEISANIDRLKAGTGIAGAVSTVTRMLAISAERRARPEQAWERIEVAGLPPSYWTDPAHRTYISLQLLAFAVLAMDFESGTPLPLEQWKKDLEQAGAWGPDVERILALMTGTASNLEGLVDHAAAAVARMAAASSAALELFEAHFRLLNALYKNDAGELAGASLARLVAGQWKHIVQSQRFALLMPHLCCPMILEACNDEARNGLQKVAVILLAAADAVQSRISKETRGFLVRIASEPSSR